MTQIKLVYCMCESKDFFYSFILVLIQCEMSKTYDICFGGKSVETLLLRCCCH